MSYAELIDFGIPKDILDKHELKIGDVVGFNYETNLSGPYVEIGSMKHFPQNLPTQQYHMPDEWFDFFAGDIEDDTNLQNLHAALTKPYAACLVEPHREERTGEEHMIISLEKDLSQTLSTEVGYLLNPSMTVLHKLSDYSSVSVVVTHDREELDDIYKGKLDTLYPGRVKYCSVETMPKDKKYYVGSNYSMLSKVRGYGYKYNLPNCLVYGMFVLSYRRQNSYDHTADNYMTYDMQLKKKNKVYNSTWGDFSPSYFYYDPTTVFRDKNFRRNCLTVVSTEKRFELSVPLHQTMYSQVSYGYPSEGTWDESVRMQDYDENFPNLKCTVRKVKLGNVAVIVDLVLPATSYEYRFNFVRKYGIFFHDVKKNYFKVNPRCSNTQVFSSDYGTACMVSGKTVNVGTGEHKYITPNDEHVFEFAETGTHLLVACTIGNRFLIDGVASRDNYVLLCLNSLHYNSKTKSALVLKPGQLQGLGVTKHVRNFLWYSKFRPGYVVATEDVGEDLYLSQVDRSLKLKLSFFKPGDGISQFIPEGLDESKFTPYLKYEKYDED